MPKIIAVGASPAMQLGQPALSQRNGGASPTPALRG